VHNSQSDPTLQSRQPLGRDTDDGYGQKIKTETVVEAQNITGQMPQWCMRFEKIGAAKT